MSIAHDKPKRPRRSKRNVLMLSLNLLNDKNFTYPFPLTRFSCDAIMTKKRETCPYGWQHE